MRISDWSSDVCSSDLDKQGGYSQKIHGWLFEIIFPLAQTGKDRLGGIQQCSRMGRCCRADLRVIESQERIGLQFGCEAWRDGGPTQTAQACHVLRSEERRVGTECFCTCKSRRAAVH